MTSEEPVSENSAPVKRTCAQRTALCRLCLYEYPKDDLLDIFSRESDSKKRILRATGIKAHRTDPATSLCTTCQKMVDLIVCFQEVCQQTELLMRRTGDINTGVAATYEDRWDTSSWLIDSLCNAVRQHREAVMAMKSSTGPVIEQKILEVNLPTKNEELREEDAVKDEQQTVIEVKHFEIKQEDEEDALQENDDELYEYVMESEQDSDQESNEEEVQPKRKRDRRKLNEPRQPEQNERIMCDTCGELVGPKYLEGHMNRHLGVQPYACDVDGCGRRSYSKYSLRQHRHSHRSKMKYYDCKVCGKRIKGTQCWRRHRMLHTEEPKHVCGVCGKKFKRSYALKLHAVVHTGEVPYACEICGKRFNVKHNLGSHYKTHKRDGTYPGIGEEQQ